MTNAEFIISLTPEQRAQVLEKYHNKFEEMICDTTTDDYCDSVGSCAECKMAWLTKEYRGNIRPFMTNYDKIKSMTLSQFAKFLSDYPRTAPCCQDTPHYKCQQHPTCKTCIQKWLLSECSIGDDDEEENDD